jgi:hypothetical protein
VTEADALEYECGTLGAPLDYTDETSLKKLNLTLIKAKAAVQSARGSILIYPSGPGMGGVLFISTI